MLRVLVSRICSARMGASVLRIPGLSGEFSLVSDFVLFDGRGSTGEGMIEANLMV